PICIFSDEARAQRTLSRVSRRWPEPDRRALAIPGVRELMAASLVEGLRQGARGAALDGALLGRRWGLDLSNANLPATYLWHGELDDQVPVARARALAQQIPHARAVFYPSDAHISTIVNHGDEIVGSLVGTWNAAQQADRRDGARLCRYPLMVSCVFSCIVPFLY